MAGCPKKHRSSKIILQQPKMLLNDEHLNNINFRLTGRHWTNSIEFRIMENNENLADLS